MPLYKTKKNTVFSLKSVCLNNEEKKEAEDDESEKKYYKFSNRILNNISSNDIFKELIKIEEIERKEYNSVDHHEPPFINVDGKNIKANNVGPHMDVIVMAKQLYLCELCFRMFRDEDLFRDHLKMFHEGKKNRPPGKRMYHCKDKNFSIWKMNKEDQRICEDLCLLGTYFLKSKTSVYTTYQFDLYTAYFKKSSGKYCFAGFYSKMPEQPEHVLSCIVVLPTMQGKGVGTMLVDFAYTMDRYPVPNYGSPEKPLSEQGKILFMKYWKAKIADYVLKEFYGPNSTNNSQLTLRKLITPISEYTGINKNDLSEAIKDLCDDIRKKSTYQSLRIRIFNQLKELLNKYRQGYFYCPNKHITNRFEIEIKKECKKRKRGYVEEPQLPCKKSISKSPLKNIKNDTSTFKTTSPNSVLSSSSASINDMDESVPSYVHKYGNNDYDMYDMPDNRSSSSTPKQKFDSPKNSYNNIEIVNMGGEPDEDDENGDADNTLTDIPPQICHSSGEGILESINNKQYSNDNNQCNDSPPPQLTPMMENVEVINNENSIEYVSPPPLLSTENIEISGNSTKQCIYNNNNNNREINPMNCPDQQLPSESGSRMIVNNIQQPTDIAHQPPTIQDDISMHNLSISTPRMIPSHIESNQNDIQPYSNISNPPPSYPNSTNILKNMEQITKISPIPPSKALEMNPMSIHSSAQQASLKSQRKENTKSKVKPHIETGGHNVVNPVINQQIRNVSNHYSQNINNHEQMTPPMAMNNNLTPQYDMNQVVPLQNMNNPFTTYNSQHNTYQDHTNNVIRASMQQSYNPYITTQYPPTPYNQPTSMNPCLYNNTGYPTMISPTGQLPHQGMAMIPNQPTMNSMNYPCFNNYPTNMAMYPGVGYHGNMYPMNLYPGFFNQMGNNMNRSQMPNFPGQMNQGNNQR
uniref:histone acetyltransferase n=1 Tax=Parastrongyloides trichosuri TaxID=131310 RepID=A0A0N4ZER2_PARTI